jgi:hypothetical protein
MQKITEARLYEDDGGGLALVLGTDDRTLPPLEIVYGIEALEAPEVEEAMLDVVENGPACFTGFLRASLKLGWPADIWEHHTQQGMIGWMRYLHDEVVRWPLIAVLHEPDSAVTLYPDKMGAAGRRAFGAALDGTTSTRADHEDGLAVWLLPADDCDPLMRASVVGTDELTHAEDAVCDGPCSVIRQSHYSDGDDFRCLTSTAGDWNSYDWSDAEVFANADAAREAIEADCSSDEIYRLDHGETGRPSYFIIPVSP